MNVRKTIQQGCGGRVEGYECALFLQRTYYLYVADAFHMLSGSTTGVFSLLSIFTATCDSQHTLIDRSVTLGVE